MEPIKIIKKPIKHTKIEYYVTFDGEDVNEAIDAALGIIARNARIRIPEGEDAETYLRKTMGDMQFEYLLKNHVMGRLSPIVISREADLDLAFEPECSSNEDPHRDEDFEFTIHALLKPKYELTSYDPVEVTVPHYVIPEEAIDKRIEQIAELNTTYKRKDDKGEPCELGQFVTIDMQTTKDGKEVPGLCGEGRLLELSYDYMPKDFIDHIVGMKVGEKKNFDFEAPKDYTGDLDDTETYNTTVEVKDFQRQMVPKISNAWVEVNVPKAGNVEGLRKQIREELEATVDKQAQQEMSAIVDSKLSERFQGKINDEIYEAAANSIYNNMRTQLAQQGKTIDDMIEEQGIDRQQLNMQVMMSAREIIRQGFSLDKLFEVKLGELTDDDIEEAYKAFAPGHEEDAKKQFEETHRMYAVEEVARRLKAHKWLLETAKVTTNDIEVPPDSIPQMSPFGAGGFPNFDESFGM